MDGPAPMEDATRASATEAIRAWAPARPSMPSMKL